MQPSTDNIGTFSRGYLCQQCRGPANFSFRVIPGETVVRASGGCPLGHNWERSWNVGQTPPSFPIVMGVLRHGDS